MQIRNLKILIDEDLARRLRAAEAEVDALAEEELDAFEAKLSHRIGRVIEGLPGEGDAPHSDVIPLRSPKKTFALQSACVGGFLMAAVALLYVHSPASRITQEPWQTKGRTPASVCHLSLIQADRSTPDVQGGEFVLDPTQAAFLKSDCSGALRLEVFQDGIWERRGPVELSEGYIVRAGELVDVRTFEGASVRVVNARGVSEELTLAGKSAP